MNNIVGMRVGERRQDVFGDAQGVVDRQSPLTVQAISNGLPFDKWRNEKEVAVRSTRVVQR